MLSIYDPYLHKAVRLLVLNVLEPEKVKALEKAAPHYPNSLEEAARYMKEAIRG